jgi:hypothetical protein
MSQGSAHGKGFPIDGHVHFHAWEAVAPSLDAAATNFARVSDRREGLIGAVLLVESARERVFERLLDGAGQGRWAFHAVADEPQSVIATAGSVAIAIVCGRQIRCDRGLEVLAYGTRERFPEGEPLADTLTKVTASGALAAVPWGFGKWVGGRAGIVRALLRSADPRALYVGDNGGRVQQLPEPKLLRAARAAGFRVLPGSDPFPFGGDERRVGAFGFLAETVPNRARPWADLRAWLDSRADSPPAYGQALGVTRFLFNQVAIQVYNRMPGRAAA